MQNYYDNPKVAFLVIDMLNAYYQEDSKLIDRKDKIVKNINELVDYAHTKSLPVIWVRQEYEKDLSDATLRNKKLNKTPRTLKGESSSQILSELHKADNDEIVIKKRSSSFFNTNLDEILEEKNINTLVVMGINSMTCVRYTVNDAFQRDYEVILALECIDGYDDIHHTTSMEYVQFSQATGLTNKEIVKEIEKYLI